MHGKQRSIQFLAFATAIALIAACGGDIDGDERISEAEYYERIERAQVCEPGDACALVTAPCDCCNLPINALLAVDFEDLHERVDCRGTCFCTPYEAAVCEDRRCVGIPKQ